MQFQQEQIDFVVTWVDGKDPVWQKERRKWKSGGHPEEEDTLSEIDDREERYRDYGLMRYWFRGVEAFAPWVRKIHFVTCGHVPEWLDTTNPKLHIVRHDSYLPENALPTFNSNAIELAIHRIEGLSERFVYFNDDIFPVKDLRPSDFFRKGLPCDMLAFQPVVANPDNPIMSHTFINNSLVISRHFDKRENIRKQPGKYYKFGYPPMYFVYNLLELAFPRFTGFYTVHGPYPFLKTTFEEVWEKEGEELRKTVFHRFRSKEDVSIYLLRDWQKLSGHFIPRNLHRDFAYYELTSDNSRLLSELRLPKKKIICINDASQEVDYEKTKGELERAFEAMLPEKCSFER